METPTPEAEAHVLAQLAQIIEAEALFIDPEDYRDREGKSSAADIYGALQALRSEHDGCDTLVLRSRTEEGQGMLDFEETEEGTSTFNLSLPIGAAQMSRALLTVTCAGS